jgi:Phage tail tube protein, GTA-gp10
MPNKHRGEIEAILDDVPHTLFLTLGALAELESAFGDDDMLALADRFSKGRISARDATRIIAAGLRAAGRDVRDSDVARMRAPNGAAGYVDIVARLLAATFGGPIAGAAAAVVLDAVNAAQSTPAPPHIDLSKQPIPRSAKAELVPDPFLGQR